MRKFKYKGRLVEAATKKQAVMKVLASAGRRVVKASTSAGEKFYDTYVKGLVSAFVNEYDVNDACGGMCDAWYRGSTNELERRSRDGFWSSNDGGVEAVFFSTPYSVVGQGYGDKKMDEEYERLEEMCKDDYKDHCESEGTECNLESDDFYEFESNWWCEGCDIFAYVRFMLTDDGELVFDISRSFDYTYGRNPQTCLEVSMPNIDVECDPAVAKNNVERFMEKVRSEVESYSFSKGVRRVNVDFQEGDKGVFASAGRRFAKATASARRARAAAGDVIDEVLGMIKEHCPGILFDNKGTTNGDDGLLYHYKAYRNDGKGSIVRFTLEDGEYGVSVYTDDDVYESPAEFAGYLNELFFRNDPLPLNKATARAGKLRASGRRVHAATIADRTKGAQVMGYERASEHVYAMIDQEKYRDFLPSCAEDDPSDEDWSEAADSYLDSMFGQDYVCVDGVEVPLGISVDDKLVVVLDVDCKGKGGKAISLAKDFVAGKLKGNSTDGDYVAVMDGVNGSPHFDIYSK